MRIGLYPGSFDPITLGHKGVIEKGSRLFDTLYVCILKNAGKTPMFTNEDKFKMVSETVKEFNNVKVVMEECLTVEACHKYNAQFILRGLRSSFDFEYEFESNNVNSVLDPSIETIFVMTNISESHISSSIVRELIGYNSKDYKKLVPIEVFNYIENKRGNK